MFGTQRAPSFGIRTLFRRHLSRKRNREIPVTVIEASLLLAVSPAKLTHCKWSNVKGRVRCGGFQRRRYIYILIISNINCNNYGECLFSNMRNGFYFPTNNKHVFTREASRPHFTLTSLSNPDSHIPLYYIVKSGICRCVYVHYLTIFKS